MESRIAILGAGSMGHLIGGLLALAGARVDLIDVDPAKVDAVRRLGVTILDGERLYRARPNAILDNEAECCYDSIIVLVKSYHTRDAARLALRIASEESVVVTLQNGLGNLEVLREHLGARAHGGSTTWGATLVEPGKVVLGGRGVVYIEEPHRGFEEPHRMLVKAMREAGLEPRVTGDIHTVIWRKVLVNAVINPITALTRARNGIIPDVEWARALAALVAGEASQVARAEGVDPGDPLEAALSVARATSRNRSSMLQDLDACRRTEVDSILGEIVRRARSRGISVPHTETLYLLVKAAEEACRGWS